MALKRLDEALATLDIAVDLLEESADGALAQPRRRVRPPKSTDTGDMGPLFSPEQLTTVKQRLDDAIERLESVLETADGAR